MSERTAICTCPDNPRGLTYREAARDPDRVYVLDDGWKPCVGFQERVHRDCPIHGIAPMEPEP